eukprot:m.115737 g.115737  ORF g.115737 m.115737 type:complete len:64 (-) comp14214_c0_seq8:2708-2899(-)
MFLILDFLFVWFVSHRLQQAKALGVNAKMLVVEDDCALAPGKGITGGRGVAGTLFAHKAGGVI